jgi:hypothetical protein
MNNRPPTTGDRKGTLVRSLIALRALAAEIECARMLSLSAGFFLVLGNDIRVESLRGLWEVGTGKDVASREAEARIPVRLGAKMWSLTKAYLYCIMYRIDKSNLDIRLKL